MTCRGRKRCGTRGSHYQWPIDDLMRPTTFIGEKPPSKVKFQSALDYVGVDLELRSKKLPSILDPDKCIEISCIDLSCKLTPTEVKNFLARFSSFRNFFKNFIEYPNFIEYSKFANGPNSIYSSIWVKKLGVRKSREFLIFRPLLVIRWSSSHSNKNVQNLNLENVYWEKTGFFLDPSIDFAYAKVKISQIVRRYRFFSLSLKYSL